MLSAGFLLMVRGTGLQEIRLVLSVLGTGILFLHAASAESDAGRTLVEMRAVELPVDRQPVTGPTVDDIESSVVDEDFSPGEATSTTPDALDEIYPPHDGYLDSTGIARPLDYLVNPLDALNEATGLRLGRSV